MKIAAANLQMSSAYRAETRHETRERLHVWVGSEGPRAERETSRPPAKSGQAHLSDAGKAAQAADPGPVEDGESADPRLRLLITLVEMLTGRPIRILEADDLCRCDEPAAVAPPPADAGPAPAADAPAGWGVEYDYHESYSETEQLSFAASGTVRTADGREISFQLSLDLQRSFQVESDVRLRLGDAARRKDPLVINFSGLAAQLSDTRFSFDLDADGRNEQLASLGAGSGFLVLDRNRDGKINNGSELFGAASGDGFSELAALDSDGNGWIDEADPAFKDLQVWSPGAQGGGQLRSLAEAGVGALALSRVATPFHLNTAANQNLGLIRDSGIFLRESGEAGTIQQIDLTV